MYKLTATSLENVALETGFLGFRNVEDVGPFSETWRALQGHTRGDVAQADVISHH